MSAFSVFHDRKKRKKNTQTPSVAEYYEARARRISRVRYTCLLLTVLFIFYGFAVHGAELTTENFRYMLKFLDFAGDEEPAEFTTLRFDRAESNRGAYYKGDIAVLNTDGLAFYSWQADRLFASGFRMESPHLVSTPQNLFAYDLGGHDVRMFNSSSMIARLTMDYPIYGFFACDTGSFAVITSEKNYRSAVYVYDEYARQIYKRLLAETYVDQVALSPDGSEFLLLGHDSKGGDLVTVLQRYSLREEEPLETITYAGELPLRISYLSADRFAVLTGSTLRCYQTNGQEGEPVLTGALALNQTSGNDKIGTLKGCSFAEGRILLTFSQNDLSGGTIVHLYDESAALCLSTRVEGDILDKQLLQNTLYLLTVGKLIAVPLDGSTPAEQDIGKDVVQLLCDSENHLIFFEKSAAYRASLP